MKRLLLFLVVLGIVFAFSTAAHSATGDEIATADLSVSTDVIEICTAWTTALEFGDQIQSDQPGTGSVTVTCSGNVKFHIGLDRGISPSGGVRHLVRVGGTEELEYTIHKQPGGELWGEAPYGAAATAFGEAYGYNDGYTGGAIASTGLPQPFTVYGVLTGDLGAPTGTYTDTVGVTVYLVE